MIALRTSLLALASIALLAVAGCPKESSSHALPPAGLAGAPGSAPPTPSVHGAPAAAGQMAGQMAGHAAAATSQPGQHPWAAAQPGAGHTAPGLGAVPVPGAAKPELEGTVVETTNAKEYTYMKVKRDDGSEEWAAVMQTAVQPGQRVKIAKEIWMSDFQSPTLGRTFDKILFGRMMQ